MMAVAAVIKEVLDNKKNYLKQYEFALKEEGHAKEEMSRLKKIIKRKPADVEDYIYEGYAYDLLNYQRKLSDAVNVWTSKRYQSICLYTDILMAISSVRDAKLRYLLILKYVKGMTWEEVCDEMEYSYAQVHRMHLAALELIDIPDL